MDVSKVMKVDMMGFRAYRYQLELVKGLAPGIQPHENALRNKTDQTILINK